ncbi:hypothetical protein PENTCL1PPCAC_3461 [Pristionchus entomophagus]|uniref:DM domain-containing protein n=1 Tax=Pristionchus entomophagus TaxID=358040 RepID=A0AAV5SD75_9BILA|nr:hypothetical protein PENTCL1PPCAC_3461 [Pristionchus entomophagus]
MPKEQYMCQLCANHGVFNQPKKGHKQKCPHRDCPCELCALNTKRRALDQIERQLKSQDLGILEYSRCYPDADFNCVFSEVDSPVASSSSSSSPELSQVESLPSAINPITSLNPFSTLFATPSLFHPFFPPSPSSNFMFQSSLGSMFLPPSLPPPPSSSPSSSSVSPNPISSKHPAGGSIHIPRNPHHSSSSPYSIALPATISRKGMKETLKNRSITAAIENIRAKSETQTTSTEVGTRKSIFHSVEQLAG